MQIHTFFDAIFFGFAVYSFLYIIVKWFAFYKKNDAFKKIEAATISVVWITGLIYLAVFLYELSTVLLGTDIEQKERFLERLSGPYSFGLWFHPLGYVISTQLVRIKRIAQNVLLRFLIAFLLFLNFEKFVIVVTSLHRDYLPSSWSMYGGYSPFLLIAMDWILKLIIFSSLVTVAYYIKNRKTF